MQNKQEKRDLVATRDDRHLHEKSDAQKRTWESVFDSKTNEKKSCKKVKFKWVY